MALDRNGTGTSTGASRDNSAEARGASNRNEGSRGGDRDRTSSSKSSSSASSKATASPNSTMSEAAQRNAYGAGRAAAQAIASGTAKSSSGGSLSSSNSKLTDRVASINNTLSSYGVNRWSSDKNTDMTEAEQRAAYGYGQDNAQKLGYVESLRAAVKNGTATPEEKAMHDQIAGKLTGRIGTNIVTGGILGRLAKNAVNSGVDAVNNSYTDQLASGIASGDLRLSESYNDKLGQGNMLDDVLSTGMSALAPVVGGVIGEALTQPNQTAISNMLKNANIKSGTSDSKASNSNGFTPPSRLTASASDLTNTTPDLSFNYDPTRYGVTSGTRGA